jgi:hypothetical protein
MKAAQPGGVQCSEAGNPFTGFLFGLGGAGEFYAAFLNESRTTRQRPV